MAHLAMESAVCTRQKTVASAAAGSMSIQFIGLISEAALDERCRLSEFAGLFPIAVLDCSQSKHQLSLKPQN
ncbi:hypothetical protein EBB07_23110 [Paenibacillaceae bacterium]|nr:hypothetical protein EBB07_23110 [Paenibacillaceae bacterium]